MISLCFILSYQGGVITLILLYRWENRGLQVSEPGFNPKKTYPGACVLYHNWNHPIPFWRKLRSLGPLSLWSNCPLEMKFGGSNGFRGFSWLAFNSWGTEWIFNPLPALLPGHKSDCSLDHSQPCLTVPLPSASGLGMGVLNYRFLPSCLRCNLLGTRGE